MGPKDIETDRPSSPVWRAAVPVVGLLLTVTALGGGIYKSLGPQRVPIPAPSQSRGAPPQASLTQNTAQFAQRDAATRQHAAAHSQVVPSHAIDYALARTASSGSIACDAHGAGGALSRHKTAKAHGELRWGAPGAGLPGNAVCSLLHSVGPAVEATNENAADESLASPASENYNSAVAMSEASVETAQLGPAPIVTALPGETQVASWPVEALEAANAPQPVYQQVDESPTAEIQPVVYQEPAPAAESVRPVAATTTSTTQSSPQSGSSGASGSGGSGASGSGGSGGSGNGSSGGSGDSTTIGVPPPKPQPQFLRQDSVLLEPGEYQFEVGAFYLHNSTTTVAAVVQEDKTAFGELRRVQRLLETPLEFRVGVSDDTQAFVNVPFGWSNGQVFFAGEAVSDNKGGIGDVSAGFTHLLQKGDNDCSTILANLSFTAPTGESTFASSLAVPGTALGQGFWSFNAGITLIRTFDPVVFFSSVGYVFRTDASYDDQHITVDPGDLVFYRFGMGYAINPKVTVTSAFSGNYIGEVGINGVGINGSDREPMQLRLAATIAKGKKTDGCKKVKYVEPYVTFGLTKSAPDCMFGTSWTW